MDSGLLSREAGELCVVFPLESTASLVRSGDGTLVWSDCGPESCYLAGGSTGAAGDGVTFRFLVVIAGSALTGIAGKVACVLAEEV